MHAQCERSRHLKYAFLSVQVETFSGKWGEYERLVLMRGQHLVTLSEQLPEAASAEAKMQQVFETYRSALCNDTIPLRLEVSDAQILHYVGVLSWLAFKLPFELPCPLVLCIAGTSCCLSWSAPFMSMLSALLQLLLHLDACFACTRDVSCKPVLLLQSRLEGRTVEMSEIEAAARPAMPNGHHESGSDSSATEDFSENGLLGWHMWRGPWWEAAEQRFTQEQVGLAFHHPVLYSTQARDRFPCQLGGSRLCVSVLVHVQSGLSYIFSREI